MISSLEATRVINQHRGDAVVVPTMTPLRLWLTLSQRTDLDLPVMGAMGKGSSLGLGVALAQPGRKVFVLDGDGSLLMNLGSLVTVGNMGPSNFYHFVFEDGVYTTTGGQPIPGEGKFSFTALARASGYRAVHDFDNLEEFASQVSDILKRPGPTLICLRVHHEVIPDFRERPSLLRAQHEAARALQGKRG
ncbi:MAG: thiamine pyrophosphate-binding protein [Chloroflexi bacterium]|nr:thiamine pyrophosphate-binding protein [Chloroflexota bacterium]